MVLPLTTSASVPALFLIKTTLLFTERHSGIYRHAILEELHYLTNFRGLQIDGLMLSPVSTALKTSSKLEAALCLHLVLGDGIAGIRTKTSTSDTK